MLGWNIQYGFNDSDFEVSENLLSIYLDEYEETPWDALKYLVIAYLCVFFLTTLFQEGLTNSSILFFLKEFYEPDLVNKIFFEKFLQPITIFCSVVSMILSFRGTFNFDKSHDVFR